MLVGLETMTADLCKIETRTGLVEMQIAEVVDRKRWLWLALLAFQIHQVEPEVELGQISFLLMERKYFEQAGQTSFVEVHQIRSVEADQMHFAEVVQMHFVGLTRKCFAEMVQISFQQMEQTHSLLVGQGLHSFPGTSQERR